MLKIGLTQRVVYDADRSERSDVLDQRWASFLESMGCCAVVIPNNPDIARRMLDEMRLDGVILTGGNDLCAFGGDAPERDETESVLWEYARRKTIPLMGICRGMQFVLVKMDCLLTAMDGHMKIRHEVYGEIHRKSVNSYHRWCHKGVLPAPLIKLAESSDGVTEAIRSEDGMIMGIMWHPERETPFVQEDIQMIRAFFEV